MSAYRPYPKYKPSGVEWLGDVPEGWEVKRARDLGTFSGSGIDKKSVEGEQPVKMFNYLDVYKSTDKILSYSPDLMDTTAPAEKAIEHAVRRGDILLTPSSETTDDIGHAARVLDVPKGVVYSYHILRFRGVGTGYPAFLTYSFNALPTRSYFASVCTGTTRMVLGRDDFKNAPFAIPPLPEQHQIASFLDRECGKLDALQAKQERLIELLKEKRQALISHAVTRGLDPTAKLKPSGIEWLGEVPEHWEVTRLKFHVSRFEQGWSPQCEGRNKEDGEIGVLKVGCVNGGTFRVEEHKALPAELEPRLQYTLKRGDLLISRANTRELVGSAAVVDRDHDDILLCDKLYRLRFHRGVSEIYLSHFLGTSEVRQQIELDATGASASMVNIGQDCIREMNLALPPLAEQRAIVAHLDEKCGKIDQLKAKAERGIELLKERRSALISAAVTGKIDVRDA
jgi:type I restriction enzyme, S subunit